ncbi:hypothetical protein BG36_07625 [Aquamicrobium defluvii]|uniref:Uncharacterized protein n=1 Tax=Aquamicrobium defluvii TaxID=69279 RepID=A0A011U0V9_9HYPH|nr:hypothetical protein BG36_07625 [Aquamicrobium defluvii]EZQ16801.1 hypothetical protein CF98_37185 [Halopseudomonas bauzanensis]
MTDAWVIASVCPERSRFSSRKPDTRRLRSSGDSPPCGAAAGSDTHAASSAGSSSASLRPAQLPKS